MSNKVKVILNNGEEGWVYPHEAEKFKTNKKERKKRVTTKENKQEIETKEQ